MIDFNDPEQLVTWAGSHDAAKLDEIQRAIDWEGDGYWEVCGKEIAAYLLLLLRERIQN